MKKILISIIMLSAAAAAGAQNTVSDTLGFRQAASINSADLLRGQISGVRVSSVDGNPAGSLNVYIRGINALRSDSQPLWIVDGVYVSPDLRDNVDAFWQYGESSYTASLNPLAFLNANEIESIEVLKDLTATAIYGSKGANGVIIVNTKRARSGENNVLWTSNAGIASSAEGGSGFAHNHYLAFNGIQNRTSYNVSGTLRSLDGPILNSKTIYGALKANFETQANSFLWFGFNAISAYGNVDSTTGVSYFGRSSATLALRDPALSPFTSYEVWGTDYDDHSEDVRGLASTYVRLNFTKSLSLKVSGGIDFQQNNRTIWYDNGTEMGRQCDDNQYGGAAGTLVSQLVSYNAAGDLIFNRYFGSDNHFRANLNVEYLGAMNKFNTINGINFVSHSLRGYGITTGAYEIMNHDFILDYGHQGGYFSMSYDFKDIFGINAVVRMDRTPKYQDNETFVRPSADAWFDVRNAFFHGSTIFSAFRLKAGFGKSGMEKYVPYDLTGNYLTSYWYTPAYGTEAFHDGINRLDSEELHITAETGFLSDRIRFGLTWFDKNTTDTFLIYAMGAKKETSDTWRWGGCEKMFERMSAVGNRGFEFDFSARIIDRTKVRWDVAANLTYSANEVTAYNDADYYGKKVGNGVYCTANYIGMPVSSLIGYSINPDGSFADLTGDGIVNTADMIPLGTTVPKVFGGFTSTVSAGRISFELSLDGAAGHNVANINTLIKDGIIGPEGTIILTKDYVERADFLRIGLIGVRYGIPVRSEWIKGLSVRLSCHNLATFTSYSGWNPDTNCFGTSTLANGLDYGTYPMIRTLMLGVSAKF